MLKRLELDLCTHPAALVYSPVEAAIDPPNTPVVDMWLGVVPAGSGHSLLSLTLSGIQWHSAGGTSAGA
eukprot:5639408-Alexandrium_andersonii.AAC.1